MKFIRDVLERAAKIQPQDDALVRDIKPEPGDRPLGELPMELRGLFAIMRDVAKELDQLERQLMEEAEDLAKQFENKPSEEMKVAREALLQKADLPIINHDTVNNMFWSSVRRVVPGAASEGSIAIRPGWQIVACKPDEPEIPGIAIPISAIAGLLSRRP